MRKSTKGALAASAGTLLLLGGLSTHATWNDDDTVAGTDINTGHLKIQNWDCTAPWKLAGVDFNPVTDLIVPNDVLTRVCTFKVDIAGNVSAALAINTPVFTGTGAAGALQATGTFNDITNAGAAISTVTSTTSGHTLQVTLNVKIDSAATGLTGQDLAAHLNDVTVTASQV